MSTVLTDDAGKIESDGKPRVRTEPEFGPHKIDPKDHEIIGLILSIVRAFYYTAQAHIDSKPALQAVMAKPEYASLSSKKMTKAITEDRISEFADSMEGFSSHVMSYSAGAAIEARYALNEARKLDSYLGAVGGFLAQDLLASFLPASAKEAPTLFSGVMDKYGVHRTARIVFNPTRGQEEEETLDEVKSVTPAAPQPE